MLTGRAFAPRTSTAKPSWHCADGGGCEIWMIQDHRPINQADHNLRPALSMFHQRGEPDQIQRTHCASHYRLRCCCAFLWLAVGRAFPNSPNSVAAYFSAASPVQGMRM